MPLPQAIWRLRKNMRIRLRDVSKVGGKLQGRPANVNAATGPKGNLLHVTDSIEGQKYLVDGGALLSIIPPTKSQRRNGPNGMGLCAANGTKIDCHVGLTNVDN